MLGMAAEADVVKVTALARWLLQAAARCTVRAQNSRAMPAELKRNNCVSSEKHTFTNAREEKQTKIAAAKYDSKTNDECSSQPSAAGSHQPTANSKRPPGGASVDGGGDDGGDGYDDETAERRKDNAQTEGLSGGEVGNQAAFGDAIAKSRGDGIISMSEHLLTASR